jgi:DNA-binding XRE family transcriptional regulator
MRISLKNNKINYYLELNQITKSQLAKAVDIPYGTIYQILSITSTSIKFEHAKKIAEFLNCDFEEMFPDHKNKKYSFRKQPMNTYLYKTRR